MHLKIEFDKLAIEDQNDSFDWYENQKLGLGYSFLDDVEHTLNKISKNSTHFGFADDEKTIRDCLLTKFPFLIVYKIFENHILIIAIHHTKKHPDKKVR